MCSRPRQVSRLWFTCGFLLVWTLLAWADPATHRLPDMKRQLQVWMGDALGGYVVAGCLPSVPGALTLGAFACEGYVRDTTTGELLWVGQAAAAVGPLSSGNGTYWVALSRSNTTAHSGWTRQTGTAYVWRQSATRPAPLSGLLLVNQITVAGGTITAVLDERVPASFARQGNYNVLDPLYGADPSGTADSATAIQAAINAARGQEVFVPPGAYRVNTQLTDIRPGVDIEVGTSHTQGLHLRGAGSMLTFFDTRVANNAMLKIEASALGEFEVRGRIEGFSLISNAVPAGSMGIQLHSQWQLDIDDVRIAGMASDGINITFANADQDGPVMVRIERSWIAGNGGWGINVVTPAGVGSVENSYLEIYRTLIFTNTLGGINLRALAFTMRDSASSLNAGSGIVFDTQGAGSGCNRTANVSNSEIAHNGPWAIEIQCLAGGKFVNVECLQTSTGGTASLGCFLLGGTAGFAVTAVEFDHTFVRVPVGVTPHTAFDIRAEAVRTDIHDTIWDLYNFAGQARYVDVGVQSRICDADAAGRYDCWPVGQTVLTTTVSASGTTYTPNASRYFHHILDVTAAAPATLTIANPINPSNGRELVLDILNRSGGLLTVTFGGLYLQSGYIDPFDATRRTLRYVFNSAYGWMLTGSNQLHPVRMLFANLAAVLQFNGFVGYCSDCNIANPCTGGGTGAIAKRLGGVYVCN